MLSSANPTSYGYLPFAGYPLEPQATMPNPASGYLAAAKRLALTWQSETCQGNYSGEVALLCIAGTTYHCEAHKDGRWHLWYYQGDRVQTVQKGQLQDLSAAQAACQRVAQSLMPAPLPPVAPLPMMPSIPVAASPLPEPNDAAKLLRQRLRLWACLTTLLGALVLTVWYGLLLYPLTTLRILSVVIGLTWGGMSLRRRLEAFLPRSSKARTSVISHHA